jgi:hypothetical protein
MFCSATYRGLHDARAQPMVWSATGILFHLPALSLHAQASAAKAPARIQIARMA